MKEKLTIKQLFAILAAGLFSFCGVLIETATNITFPTLMNEFHISTSLVQWMTTGNLLYYDSYFILFKKKISDKKIIFDSRVLIFNRIDC